LAFIAPNFGVDLKDIDDSYHLSKSVSSNQNQYGNPYEMMMGIKNNPLPIDPV
jgi:hypothetical protein